MFGRFRNSRNEPTRLLAPLSAALFLLAYLAVAVLAAPAAEPVTFFACLDDKGTLTRVVTSPIQPPMCGDKEWAVSWNQVGPQGAPGQSGPPGPAGGNGPGTPNRVVIGRAAIHGFTGAEGLDIVGFRAEVKQIPGTD